ncbi:MAG: hypothetical protein IT290_13380 [Deltaproteobacteria bacterium]|nr:hypothetical protein [Deltaproteobacteria bacterium]
MPYVQLNTGLRTLATGLVERCGRHGWTRRDELEAICILLVLFGELRASLVLHSEERESEAFELIDAFVQAGNTSGNRSTLRNEIRSVQRIGELDGTDDTQLRDLFTLAWADAEEHPESTTAVEYALLALINWPSLLEPELSPEWELVFPLLEVSTELIRERHRGDFPDPNGARTLALLAEKFLRKLVEDCELTAHLGGLIDIVRPGFVIQHEETGDGA